MLPVSPSLNRTAPRFAARIKVVPKEQFLALEPDPVILKDRKNGRTIHEDDLYTLNDVVLETERGVSTHAYDCSMFGLYNPAAGVIIRHLSPRSLDGKKIYSLADSAQKFVGLIKTEFGLLEEIAPGTRAFLTGGQAKDKLSMRLKREILTGLKTLGIPVSVLWGKQFGDTPTHMHYSVKDDCWHITHDSYPHDSLPEVKLMLTEVDIAPGDELEINGIRVEPDQASWKICF